MLQQAHPVAPQRSGSVKALRLLKENVRTLLHHRKEDQSTLAAWVGHSKSWINKFLNDETDRTELQLRDLDKIADFFGIEAYQLFQPGISLLTERRLSGTDRRSGQERRIGHQGRQLAHLRTEVNKLPHVGGGDLGGSTTSRLSAADRERQRLIEQFERDLHALNARQQTPTPGVGVPKRAAGRRGASGSDAKSTK